MVIFFYNPGLNKNCKSPSLFLFKIPPDRRSRYQSVFFKTSLAFSWVS
jgi:hypothetical protein